MRFISAQYIAYFKNDLWKTCASNANEMATVLAEKLKDIPEVKITQKVESNGVFVIMPAEVAEKVRQHYFFYPWDEKRSEWRLMCSWDTKKEDIEEFVVLLKESAQSTQRVNPL
jgi:threonine aldolase